MSDGLRLRECSPAFRLMIATSWLAPDLWHSEQRQAIGEAIDAGVDWAEYLRLVDRHRIPAVSWAGLRSVPGMDVPEPVQQRLQQRSDACRLQAVGHALLLAELLKAFSGEGIGVMPMKGPLLSLELYGDIGLRQSKDLDIMVSPQDLSCAEACLERMGWRHDANSFPMSPRQREAVLRHEHHIGFTRPQTTCRLELHWRTLWDTPDHTAHRWTRSATASWRGHAYRTMNPVDAALYLCSHGSDHAWFRAKWLGDLARMYTTNLVDWEVTLEEAGRTKEERPILLCLRLLNEAYGFEVSSARELPSFLIDAVVIDLTAGREPEPTRPLRRLGITLRKARYNHLLRPDKSWRQSLVDLCYSGQDLRVFRLPDSFFWAYAPLRPVLWIWRRLLCGQPATTTGK